MNFRKLVPFSILLATSLASTIADTNHPASPNDFALTLRHGKERVLSPEAVQTLFSKAAELLASSNFNSRGSRPGPDWDILRLHNEYRQTVSGKYLLVSFKKPRKTKTIGGEVSVSEIVIGLNRPDYASALFTVDEEGRIIGHAKYSGRLCVEFLKLVRKIADDA